MSLYASWIEAKETERQAIEARRQIEDELVKKLRISPALEGAQAVHSSGYVIKITGRMSRKIDGDKLQEIAAEHDLTAHLPSLFRWKPELNMSAWKSADESITAPLLGAITTTPGRPSFTITKEQ